jgi:hypothetical protein
MGGMDIQGEKVLESVNCHVDYKYFVEQKSFSNIPGTPIAYWIEPEIINAFKNGKKLGLMSDVKEGLKTGNNDRFLRFWHEVEIDKVGFNTKDFIHAKDSNKKWFPHNKGGSFRKWYGNQEYIINYENDGYELKNFKPSALSNKIFYFKESISWSKVSSGSIAFRFFPHGFLFDNAGLSVFTTADMFYLLGFLNSKVSKSILSLISPTLNYTVGNIKSLPVIYSENLDIVNELVKENIDLSKNDWNNFETSWNFTKHPFLENETHDGLISSAYDQWIKITETNFYNLRNNEESLNEIFFKIYKLNTSPKLEDAEITINKADLERDVKSFISYFIGCLFGRYSLDEDGLICAGENIDHFKYQKFIPDEDNIIPVLDNEHFVDDIITKFSEFLKITFWEETLEENLKFIANALGKKGKTYREVIRNYFLTDFYKDHLKTYKKTPIYWLFDSGKENGFKALIYMHRYTPDTVARIRTDYLHKTQMALEIAINNNQQIIQNSTNKNEIAIAEKDNTKLLKQLEETKKYDEALGHIANKQIAIDLDDGVKTNYSKFQNVEIRSSGNKIDLLKKL